MHLLTKILTNVSKPFICRQNRLTSGLTVAYSGELDAAPTDWEGARLSNVTSPQKFLWLLYNQRLSHFCEHTQGSGSQCGVWGPPEVLERPPGFHQQNVEQLSFIVV